MLPTGREQFDASIDIFLDVAQKAAQKRKAKRHRFVRDEGNLTLGQKSGDQLYARAKGKPKSATIQPRFSLCHNKYSALEWHLLPALTKDKIKADETNTRRQYESSLLSGAIEMNQNSLEAVREVDQTLEKLRRREKRQDSVFKAKQKKQSSAAWIKHVATGTEEPPLCRAARLGDEAAVLELLHGSKGARKADPDKNRNPVSGNTALHSAAMIGSESLVRVLLDAGARADIRNAMGHTAEEITKRSSVRALLADKRKNSEMMVQVQQQNSPEADREPPPESVLVSAMSVSEECMVDEILTRLSAFHDQISPRAVRAALLGSPYEPFSDWLLNESRKGQRRWKVFSGGCRSNGQIISRNQLSFGILSYLRGAEPLETSPLYIRHQLDKDYGRTHQRETDRKQKAFVAKVESNRRLNRLKSPKPLLVSYAASRMPPRQSDAEHPQTIYVRQQELRTNLCWLCAEEQAEIRCYQCAATMCKQCDTAVHQCDHPDHWEHGLSESPPKPPPSLDSMSMEHERRLLNLKSPEQLESESRAKQEEARRMKIEFLRHAEENALENTVTEEAAFANTTNDTDEQDDSAPVDEAEADEEVDSRVELDEKPQENEPENQDAEADDDNKPEEVVDNQAELKPQPFEDEDEPETPVAESPPELLPEPLPEAESAPRGFFSEVKTVADQVMEEQALESRKPEESLAVQVSYQGEAIGKLELHAGRGTLAPQPELKPLEAHHKGGGARSAAEKGV